MTHNNECRAFRRIVANVPDWMIRAYELGQLLKDYDKSMKQLTAEVGAHRAVEIDTQIGKVACAKVFEEVLEEIRRARLRSDSTE